jgi:serine/threonine-protein kinase
MSAMTKTCRGCGREFSGGETFCPVDGSRLSSPSQACDLNACADPLVGATLGGRYRILRAIGEGGMGVVYEAEHELIEKRVALKVLRDAFTRRPDVVERFRQEAKSASKIGHPNIVDVSDFGETPTGASYIVLEMLKGEDLADVLSRECALAPTRAVLIVHQVAKALDAAHKKNIIHRDLKPENIYLVARDGQPDFVKVVDFGVAKMGDIESLGNRKLTRTGMIFGTPEYMSPEHAGGKALDHRVDIYALGVILYELLTGRVPFEGDNFMEVLAKHGHDPVPPLREVNPGTRVSPELERALFRALEKDPERRYRSMSDFAADLRGAPEMPSILPHESVVPPQWALSAPPPLPGKVSTAPVESAARRDSSALRRLPWRWLAPAAAAVMLAVVWSSVFGNSEAAPVATSIDAAADSHAASAAAARPVPVVLPVATSSAARSAAAQAPAPDLARVQPQPLAAQPVPTKPPDGPVQVTIRTQPAGARVGLEGGGELCRTTPCAADLPRNTPLTLRATLRRLTAVRSLTLDAPTELTLKLGLPPRSSVSVVRASASAATTKRRAAAPVPDVFR